MRIFGAVFAAAVMLSPCAAQTIDEYTKCSRVSDVMDGTSPNNREIKELSLYIFTVLRSIDHTYKVLGYAEIIPKMNEKGKLNLVASITARCRETPDDTIFDKTFYVYDGTRGLQEELGIIKRPRR